MRTIIAGVSSPQSEHRSLDALLHETLARDAPITAARVVVEDLSEDPLEAARRLDDEWPRFERVILVGAVTRERPPGTITAYRWDGEADARDGDTAHFDTTLLALKELADVPDELIVVEIEPDVHERLGRDVTPEVGAALARARTLLRRLATNGRASQDLPRSALGGYRASAKAD